MRKEQPVMMGRKERIFDPSPPVTLEELVPPDHFYRHLERTLDLRLAATEANLKPATSRRYSDLMRLHVLPIIGGIQMQQFSALHVQKLHARWHEKGLSPTSCYHAHYILHRALSQAVRWRILVTNPCKLVDAPRRSTPETKT